MQSVKRSGTGNQLELRRKHKLETSGSHAQDHKMGSQD